MTKAEQARLVAWRLRMLQHAGNGARQVAQTCRHFGISRKTFYKWKKRFDSDGPAALCDQPSRPHRSPGAFSRDIISKVLYLRQNYHFGPGRIADYLRRFHGVAVAVSSVHRILLRHGMNRLPANQKHRAHTKRWQRYEKPQPGHRLQMDVKFLERIPGSRKRLYQFTAIDDCTRIRVLKVFDACNQATAISFMNDVLRRLPFRVHVVQTDNGLSQKSRTQSFAMLANARGEESGTRRRPDGFRRVRRDALTIVTEGRVRCARPARAQYSVAIQAEGPRIIYEVVGDASTACGEGIRPPGLVASGKRR